MNLELTKTLTDDEGNETEITLTIEVEFSKGYRGTLEEPDEPPSYDITEITDENGDVWAGELDDDDTSRLEQMILDEATSQLVNGD